MGSAALERPKAGESVYQVSTIGEVAEFFGVSAAAVSKWAAESDPMPGRKGSYDLSLIAQWKLRRAQGNRGLSDELKAAEIRLKTVQAEQKELELRQQKNELLDKREVQLWAATICIETREAFMSIPERIAIACPIQVKEFARSESEQIIRQTLTALARQLNEPPDNPEAIPDDERV